MTLLISRRTVLEGLGLTAAGLAIGTFRADAETLPEGPGLRTGPFVFIAPNGQVTIVCHRSEMGQGVRSSLPVLIAGELGADLGRISVLQGDGDPAYGDQNTDGSASVRKLFDDLRRAGATARTALVVAAAKLWKVPAESCTAEDHQVRHGPSGRALDFAALVAAAKKAPLPDPKTVTLRPLSELKQLGRELALLDGPAIVTGRAVFGADVFLPGMLTAVIVRPKVLFGQVASYDATRALAIPGVRKIVELPVPKPPIGFAPLGGLAVVARDTWSAIRGAEALEVTWEDGENAAYDSETYRQELLRSISAPGQTVRETGDVDRALAGASSRISAVYEAPHLAHAPMEPPVALARFEGGRCEIWTPTQHPQAAQEWVAKALGIEPKDVTLHVTLLGGGFGRKAKADYVVEAALVARAMGTPVRVQWLRADDLQADYYHTVSAQRIEAGLDAAGKVVAWQHRIAFPPHRTLFEDTKFGQPGDLAQGILDLALAVPHLRAEICEAKAHTRLGWLRSVANIYHAFAVQTFFDELAEKRGVDPKDNLLELLGPARQVGLTELGVEALRNYGQPLSEHPVDVGRLRHVLDRATTLARWSERKADGRKLGLAAHRSFLAYVAVVASVVADERGRPRVDEVWIVGDHGLIVNRERVRAQLEGAVVFGMSAALYGAITMKGGRTEQRNFRDYRLVRMAEAPRQIHVEIIPSDAPPAGVGEPGVPPVAPAIGNALYQLTGTRLRTMPFAKTLVGLGRG